MIEDDTKELVKLAKKMKKNNVAVDFINFGESSENTEKLEKFRDAVNSNDNSHVVTIPPGPQLLSDQIAPLFMDSEFAGGDPSSSLGLGGDYDLGMDDPELALALRMSLEDEKARQEKVKREQAEKEKADASKGESSSAAGEPAAESSSSKPEEAESKDAPKKDKDGDDIMDM